MTRTTADPASRWGQEGLARGTGRRIHPNNTSRLGYDLGPLSMPRPPLGRLRRPWEWIIGTGHRIQSFKRVTTGRHVVCIQSLDGPLYGPEHTLKRPDTHPTNNREMNPRSQRAYIETKYDRNLLSAHRFFNAAAAARKPPPFISPSLLHRLLPVHSFSRREPLSSL